jgi:hypothetical protein
MIDPDVRDGEDGLPSEMGCPRCQGTEVIPWSWGTHGAWFQCTACHKIWEEDLTSSSAREAVEPQGVGDPR